jgi:integrase
MMNVVLPVDEMLKLEDFLVETWLPNVRRTIRATTYASYSGHVRRHLCPSLGAIPLEGLTAMDLNNLYASLLSSGLTTSTLCRVHATVHRALRDAVRWGFVKKNCAVDADPPKARAGDGQEMQTWTAEELRRFLTFTMDDVLYDFWFLISMTGLRRGEALGLRWQDVDLEAGQLAVRQTFVTVGYVVKPSMPKTKRGQRVVALDPTTTAVLAKRHESSHLPVALVFQSESGGPLHPIAVTKRFKRLVEASGLPQIRLHDLRHTHATLALSAGIHPKIVSERLGHSTVAFTLDVYSHSSPHLQRAAAESMANVVFPAMGLIRCRLRKQSLS